MSVQKLPQEVLGQIFQLASRPDLYQCLFVNKAWYAAAIQEYYREIVLGEGNTKLLRPKLLGNVFGESFDGGRWVKKLKVLDDESSRIIYGVRQEDSIKKLLKPGEFATLLSYLPHLEKIDLGSNKQFMLYKDILNSALDSRDSLNDIQCISINFGSYTSKETMKEYFLICYKLRQNLTSLSINNLAMKYTIDGQTGTCLRFLPDFKKLTHLSVYNSDYHSTGDKRLVIFTLFLKTCPNLVKFYYDGECPIPEKRAAALLTQIDAPKTDGKYNISALKEFGLSVPILTKSYMKYVTAYINPAQLKQFNLQMMGNEMFDHEEGGLNFGEWIKGDDNMETVMEFARYLNLCKTVYIHTMNLASHNEPNLSLKTEYERLWKFVDAVKGIKNTYNRVHFRVVPFFNDGATPDAWFRIIDNQKLVLDYTTQLEQEDFPDDTLSPSFLPLDPVKNIAAGPQMIDSLDIIVENIDIKPYFTMGGFLQKVLPNCPHLVLFYIEIRPSFSFINIEYPINLRKGVIRDDTGVFDHLKKKDSAAKKEEDNDRNKLTLYQSLMTPQICSVISENLPYLETIECYGCWFAFDDRNNVTLDFKNIRKLDHLILQIDNIPFRKCSNMFIRFKFSKEEVCYKLVKLQQKKNKEEPSYDFKTVGNKYVRQFKTFNSLHNTVITISCGDIKLFTMSDNLNKNTFTLTRGGSPENQEGGESPSSAN